MPTDPSSFLTPGAWAPGQFANRVIFCTGGAGTICSGQVRALVHLGANACIIGRNPEKTETVAKDIATVREGAKVLGIGNVDVRKIGDLEAAVERCVKELGGIDYAIAGAAGNFLAPMTGLSANAFKTVMDIDVLGSYNTVKAVLPHLEASAKKNSSKPDSETPTHYDVPARLIFVSATLHYTGTPLQTHVMAAKAAVDALSTACAIELGPRGITSNVISPGGIAETEGLARLSRKEDNAAAARAIPLGRLGYVKDVADATVWLCSQAGRYINGTVVVVDGGAWRTQGGMAGSGFKYPDFLLSGGEVSGVKGMKKDKNASKL